VGSSPTRHLRFAKRTGRTHRAAPQRILAREDVRRDRPLTGREIRFRKTCKSERAAQIELGKLLEQAAAGRQPDSDVTVAELLDRYVSTAGWDVSTRVNNPGYIRRTIKPAPGSMEVRRVRGPLLDTLYVQLMRCGNLAWTGRPFTEHRNIPDLRPGPADPQVRAHQPRRSRPPGCIRRNEHHIYAVDPG
jgi:hypothetical protein